MTSAEANYPVARLGDDEENGLSAIMVSLLEENLTDERTARVARRIRRPIALINSEDGSATTIEFRGDSTMVSDGLHGNLAVTVEGTVDQLLALSHLRIKAGGLLPVGFFTPLGLRVLAKILSGRLKVRGLVRHPLTVLRLLAVVSIAD